MHEFKRTEERIGKILATLRQLAVDNKRLREKLRKRDEPLVAKVLRLERAVETMAAHARAREEVLKQMSDRLDYREQQSGELR